MSGALLVNIDVPDLGKAISFYEDALGFRRSRLLFGGGVAEMTFDGVRIYLIEREQGSPAVGNASPRVYEDHWTPVHLDIAVPDLAGALTRATGAGARLCGEVRRNVWGDIATLRDPFGHGICLIQFHGEPYGTVVV